MSISSRSSTLVIYTPTVTNDGGYASSTYTTDGTEYFCRAVESSVRERMATGQPADATTAVVELADEIPVPKNALFRLNGLTYRIKGATRRPAKRIVQYTVEWLDQPFTGVPA